MKIYMVYSEAHESIPSDGWFYFLEEKDDSELHKRFPEGFVKYEIIAENNVIIESDYSDKHICQKFFKTIGFNMLVAYYCDIWSYDIRQSDSKNYTLEDCYTGEKRTMTRKEIIKKITTDLNSIINSNDHVNNFKEECKIYKSLIR